MKKTRKTLFASLTRSERSTLDELISFYQGFGYQGLGYPYLQTSLGGTPAQEIGGDFDGLSNAYKSNAIVFSCMDVRKRVFSEARMKFRELNPDGKPGDLFTTEALARLEHPWVNGSTGDLLARAISDVDLAGNFYALRRPEGIQRLRPDWMTIVKGSRSLPDNPSGAPDMELVGYYYRPANSGKGVMFEPGDVAHWAPIPDPAGDFRGISWLTPLVREILSDQAAMEHKLKFFEQGATPNTVIKMDPAVSEEAFQNWVELFRANHEGAANAYKTMFLGGGADATVIGSNLRQLDFKEIQGHGETRIAAAAGVPPIVVGLSEGLEAATYSNYGQARRSFADTTLRFLWRTFGEAMASIIDVPARSELWYDASDIPFLREDERDLADIQVAQAGAIKSLTEAGFDPDSAVKAIAGGDLDALEHTGLTSVQLLPPGEQKNPPPMPFMPGGGTVTPGNGQPSPDAAASLVNRVAESLLLDAGES